MAGTDFNIDSPKQLGQILFEVLVITDKPPKTKTGQFSTNEDVLTKLTEKHEIVEKVLSYGSVKKLKTTYADALPNIKCNSRRNFLRYLLIWGYVHYYCR